MGAKYLALDNETGGLAHHYPSLLSTYLLALDENFNTVAELDLLVKPEDGVYAVTAEALNVNKINLIEHDKIAITEREAKTAIKNFLYKLNPDGKDKLVPIGHNVYFDIAFLTRSYGLDLNPGTWNKYVSYRVLDTGTIAAFLKASSKMPEDLKGSLGALADYYNIEFPEKYRHTAKGDTLATVEVLKRMLNE